MKSGRWYRRCLFTGICSIDSLKTRHELPCCTAKKFPSSILRIAALVLRPFSMPFARLLLPVLLVRPLGFGTFQKGLLLRD